MLIMVRYLKKNMWNQPGPKPSQVTWSSSPAPKQICKFPGMIACFQVARNSGPALKSLLTPEFRPWPGSVDIGARAKKATYVHENTRLDSPKYLADQRVEDPR